MKILVYGWYGKEHNNLGDQFFIEIFRALFPLYHLTFTDYLNASIVSGQDAIFLGGGSFLDQANAITDIEIIKNKSIFYLGVGSETNIHNTHLQLLQVAKLIVLRSSDKIEQIEKINSNVLLASDLVYCAPIPILHPIKTKSVLILPNISIVPKILDPHWKFAAWNYFKAEMSQFLDTLIEDGFHINFFPMQQSDQQNDNWAAIEVINQMRFSSHSYLLQRPETIQETIQLFSKYETIITQRFHGIVLSEMAKRPCITIAHHDKLSFGDPNALSLYGINKTLLHKQLSQLRETNYVKPLPINLHHWENVVQQVKKILGGENGEMGGNT